MTIKALNYGTAIAAPTNGRILPIQRQLAIAKCAELAALVDQHTSSERSGYYPTAIDPLVFVRCDNSKTIEEVSEPG